MEEQQNGIWGNNYDSQYSIIILIIELRKLRLRKL